MDFFIFILAFPISELASDPAYCNLNTEVVMCKFGCTAKYVGTKFHCKGESYPGKP